MKKLTKLFIGVILALSLTTAVFAQDSNTISAGNAVQTTQVASVPNAALFNTHELALQIATGYVIDKSALFQNKYSLNLEAGMSYYLTKYLGLEATVPFFQSAGVSVQEVQAGLLLRLPLANSVPVLRNFAPYGGIGAVYNWETKENWAYVLKGGVEFRLKDGWGIFGEYRYRATDFAFNGKGESTLEGGLRLVL